MNKAILLIGPPGSGKTHYYNERMKDSSDFSHYVYLSIDKHLAIEAEHLGKRPKEVYKQYISTAINLYEVEFINSIDNSFPVIIEDRSLNFLNPRKKMVSFLKTAGYDVSGILFISDTYWDLCTSMAKKDIENQFPQVPSSVMLNSWTNITENPPTFSEGFSKLITPNHYRLPYQKGY